MRITLEEDANRKAKKDAIDEVFEAQETNDNGRKSIAKARATRQKIEFSQDGTAVLKALKLSIQTRLAYAGKKKGVGLFTKLQSFEFLKKKTTETKWWTWTPVKLKNNKLCNYGEITCRACNFTPMYLKSITDHLVMACHSENVEKKKKIAEGKMAPAKLLQQRVDAIIQCSRHISPEDTQHRIDAIRAAATSNIAISALEDLDASDFMCRHQTKHASLGHITHLADDILPIVHTQDIEILKTILCPANKKNDTRSKILAYQHFSIIFDGTPSFAEAEVSVIK